jgi:hypothetical protein
MVVEGQNPSRRRCSARPSEKEAGKSEWWRGKSVGAGFPMTIGDSRGGRSSPESASDWQHQAAAAESPGQGAGSGEKWRREMRGGGGSGRFALAEWAGQASWASACWPADPSPALVKKKKNVYLILEFLENDNNTL